MSAMMELTLKKSNGSLLTRIEAEKELWDKCKTSHAMRRLANGQFGLDPRFAWNMKPTSVTHWLLDEFIRKKLIAGEPIGIQPELESDDSYFKQYVQKLRVFVEDGLALPPKDGEGIDMSDYQQMPPNGQPPQPGFSPPPPPQMNFGQQSAPPQQPPPPQYQQPPMPQQMGGYGPPPQQPSQYGVPPQPQFGNQPSFPPQGAPPPIMQPQVVPPPQQAAPPAPPAQSPSNRRRAKAETQQVAAPASIPQQQSMPFPGAPVPQSGFSAPPSMPQFGQPPMPQFAPQQQAPVGIPNGDNAQIAELKTLIEGQAKLIAALCGEMANLKHSLKRVDVVSGIHLRQIFGRPQSTRLDEMGTESVFKEINMPFPT